MMYSAVLIIPADMKPDADAVGAAMGWGPVSYTIPLGDGESVTHYGARADVSARFIRWVRGLDPLLVPAAQPVIDALIAEFSPDHNSPDVPALWGWEHFRAVLAKQGLINVAA